MNLPDHSPHWPSSSPTVNSPPRPASSSVARAALATALVVSAVLGTPGRASGDNGIATTADPPGVSRAPYIMVTSDTPEPDPLPLKETRGDVHIAGVIAHVRITQVYRNEGPRPLEATYVFPGSTRAAVFATRMQVGDRTIEAAIEKREAARKIYEQARKQGKTASLLEQQRPNVFQMNVANILPGDTVKVELDYTELIVPDESVYEFVYPAVVGPRYAGEQKSGETWHENPYLEEGEPEPYRFGVNVHLSTGMGIHTLSSPSHRVQPKFRGPGDATMSIGGPGARGAGNRDFVVRYRLRGNAIQTGLLRFEGEKEKFFLMMMQPPDRVAPASMPRREYVFIVDVSGSMSGFPLEVSKRLVKDLLTGLRPVDRFNILFFAGGSYQLGRSSLSASGANIRRAMKVLDERRGSGGTNLLAALRRALAMPHARGTSRTFVAVTDGYVNVEAEAFGLVREKLGEANFFAFGIGSSVNRHLIEGLARAGMGEPFVVIDQNQSRQQAGRFRRMIASPALTDIKISFSGFDAYDVEPLAVPDLMAERPLVIFGKYRGDGDGAISVWGSSGAGPYKTTLQVARFAPQKSHEALRYLWARHRIRTLKDRQLLLSENVEEEITALGLRYHLMTDYTSFVAVDQIQRASGPSDTVKQPLPLPAGVSDRAVAQEPGATRVQGSSPRRRVRAVMREPSDDEDSDWGVSGDAYGGETSEAIIVMSGASSGGAIHLGNDIRSDALSALTSRTVSLSQRFDLGSVGDRTVLSIPTLVRVGVTERLEARVASNLISLSDGDLARPDLTLGGKLLLRDRLDSLALGVLGDVTLDFDDATGREFEARFLLLGERPLTSSTLLRLNLGLGLSSLSDSDDLQQSLLYAAELGYYLSHRWLSFAGTSGQVADESTFALQGGLGYQLIPRLSLGASATLEFGEGDSDVVGGLFLRWGL